MRVYPSTEFLDLHVEVIYKGPQGTVSSVVIENEKRLLKSLREIKDPLDRFSPFPSARFNIKSILTLVVENTFSEMRTGASDVPLKLEFHYSFSRSIKERLKRQCLTPYSYFTSPSSYYPHTFVSANYSNLPKLRPPKRNKLTVQQVHEMSNGRVIHGQSVPPKNCTKYDHQRQSRNSPYQFICRGLTKRPAT